MLQSSPSESLTVRAGTPADVPAMLRLVRELAEYERAAHEVENTEARILADGFGPNPVFGLIVAQLGAETVGMSVYYFRYSTWKGKRLYLEDIIVTEARRGQGIGHRLFAATMQAALDTGCSGMTWQVLDWNTPAIRFYQKYGAQLDGQWLNGTLSRTDMEARLAENHP